jgi:DNA-binding LytR/AlgR family response regulator
MIKTRKEEFVFSYPLKDLEKLFTFNYFIRVSRSYILNITNCIELKIGLKPEVIMSNGDRVTINDYALQTLKKHFEIG